MRTDSVEGVLRERDRRRRERARLLSFLSLLAGTFVGLTSLALFAVMTSETDLKRVIDDFAFPQVSKLDDEMLQRLAALEQRLAAITQLPEGYKPEMQAVEMEQRIIALETSLSVIEKAVVDNPERAMSIPMLRRDIDSLAEISALTAAQSRDDIGRIYDQNKWFIGLMATIAIAVIGLAVGNLRRSKEEKSQ